MQQVAQIERERDDFKTQVASVKKQLHEAHESQSKGDSKLNKVLQSLRSLQDEKGSLEARLGQKEVALQAQVINKLKNNFVCLIFMHISDRGIAEKDPRNSGNER